MSNKFCIKAPLTSTGTTRKPNQTKMLFITNRLRHSILPHPRQGTPYSSPYRHGPVLCKSIFISHLSTPIRTKHRCFAGYLHNSIVIHAEITHSMADPLSGRPARTTRHPFMDRRSSHSVESMIPIRAAPCIWFEIKWLEFQTTRRSSFECTAGFESSKKDSPMRVPLPKICVVETRVNPARR